MDEKIIIKSSRYSNAVIIGCLIAISLCIPVLYFVVCALIYGGYTMEEFMYTDGGAIIPKILTPVFFVIFLWAIYFTEIVVTNKRVYGKTMFGKRVDLPIDSISAVGTSALNSIAITTASGAIKFVMIKNRNEIHDAVSKLLIERQTKEAPAAPTTIKQEVSASNADELKKYKELLDMGAITQEEFDAKKKQLLGL